MFLFIPIPLPVHPNCRFTCHLPSHTHTHTRTQYTASKPQCSSPALHPSFTSHAHLITPIHNASHTKSPSQSHTHTQPLQRKNISPSPHPQNPSSRNAHQNNGRRTLGVRKHRRKRRRASNPHRLFPARLPQNLRHVKCLLSAQSLRRTHDRCIPLLRLQPSQRHS